MDESNLKLPEEIIHQIIQENGPFPNNSQLPVLIYKNCLANSSSNSIKQLFLKNGWKNVWVNGIHPFHHYHSNVHEVLGISSGQCDVQLGGESGLVFSVEKSDVIILPAGMSHKNIRSTGDFVCVGGYPVDTPYDMNYGKKEERGIVDQNIQASPLPKSDPVYGPDGPLFEYWES